MTLLLALFGACATETGNPELDVELRTTATTSSARVGLALPSVRVEEAWVVIGDVRLVEADSCDTPTEIEHTAEGPFVTDLHDGAGTIRIPAAATEYCRLRVRLDKADGGGPADLDDHSVLLSGTRADGVLFDVRSRDGFELDLRSRGEPFPLATGTETLLLAFDVGAWLDAADIPGATPGGDGAIHIDEDHERDRLDAFEAAVEAALGLYADDGGDGALDDDDTLLAD